MKRCIAVSHLLWFGFSDFSLAHLNSALIARGNEVAVYDLCYTLCQAFQMGLPSVSMGDGQGTMMRWLNEKIKDSGIAITNFNEEYVSTPFDPKKMVC